MWPRRISSLRTSGCSFAITRSSSEPFFSVHPEALSRLISSAACSAFSPGSVWSSHAWVIRFGNASAARVSGGGSVLPSCPYSDVRADTASCTSASFSVALFASAPRSRPAGAGVTPLPRPGAPLVGRCGALPTSPSRCATVKSSTFAPSLNISTRMLPWPTLPTAIASGFVSCRRFSMNCFVLPSVPAMSLRPCSSFTPGGALANFPLFGSCHGFPETVGWYTPASSSMSPRSVAIKSSTWPLPVGGEHVGAAELARHLLDVRLRRSLVSRTTERLDRVLQVSGAGDREAAVRHGSALGREPLPLGHAHVAEAELVRLELLQREPAARARVVRVKLVPLDQPPRVRGDLRPPFTHEVVVLHCVSFPASPVLDKTSPTKSIWSRTSSGPSPSARNRVSLLESYQATPPSSGRSVCGTTSTLKLAAMIGRHPRVPFGCSSTSRASSMENTLPFRATHSGSVRPVIPPAPSNACTWATPASL